ncbi:hypothetical protein evm_014841 [Chilo suppressalis]|nr:hypothetical protein evm_014841 [Chilo suppressalis]
MKKCERYWPHVTQEERSRGLVVRTVSETYYEDYFLRELDVTYQDCCRTVYQYQFTAWPDHGTPAEPDGVLNFIYDINRRNTQIKLDKNPPEQNVVCVHCSAGVGRTGTFIVLDMLIDKIKTSGENYMMI